MNQRRGGCLGSILGALAGGWIAFQVRAYLLKDGFFDGLPDPTISEFLQIGLFLGAILLGSIIMSVVTSEMLTAIIPSWRREAKLKSRQKEALRKRIKERAEYIVSALGKYGVFSDEKIQIQVAGNRTIIKSGSGAGGDLVFEGVFVPAEYSSQDLGTYLEPQDDGSYKVEHRTSTSGRSSFVHIKAYVPGGWERHIKKLGSIAAKKAEEDRRHKAREAKVEETRRFNL